MPFAVAAHNAGIGGALQGHAIGGLDRLTAGRDCSAWVTRHRFVGQHWLHAHPAWQPEA